MELCDILQPGAVIPALKAVSKKQALQELAERAAVMTGLGERDIYDRLAERERMGSTGIGAGIAIPHGEIGALDHIVGLFARFDRPIDFASLDDQPVDLAFVLLTPEGAGPDHLKALARVARILRDPKTTAKLRAANDADAIFALLTEQHVTPSAA
jgi:PTS system nitrogen regulatory IIA component